MSFQTLDQRDEENLHRTRLLNVEEKTFKRITKRLLTPGSLVSTPSKLPTPPPDAAEESSLEQVIEERRQFREDVLFDFAAFDSSIARIQFLRNSNEKERERYVADKQRILEKGQEVRDSTAQLRVQLEEAKATLEQRKKFDKLAEKITTNKALKSREEQAVSLRKLEEECRELERESLTYGETWQERREQFGRIVEEGMQLRRLIRDEKEEVERREGMDGGEEDGEVGEAGTPKESSYNGDATPRPEGHAEGQTGDSPGSSNRLKPRPLASGSLSRSGSRSNSRVPSPAPSERRVEEDAVMLDSGLKVADSDVAADTPMAEVAETPAAEAETPRISVDEAAEDGHVEDKMDTT